MADDNSGALRGLAQIVKSPSVGNLYLLGRLQQQKQLADRDFMQKRQDAAMKTFADTSNGLYVAKNLDPILQEADRTSFTNTYKAMSDVMRTAQRSNNYANVGTALIDLKNNHDGFSRGLESIGQTAKTIQDLVLGDKEGIYNKEAVGNALNDLKEKALVHENGQVVGINYDEAAKINKVLENPDFYNKSTMAKLWVKGRGEQELSSLKETQDAYFTRTDKITSDLFETEVKNGQVSLKRDPNGVPIPKATPEAVADFIGEPGSIHEKILKSWAETLPRLKNGELDMGSAFKKYVVSPYAKAEVGKTTINEKSTAAAGLKLKEQLGNQRYDTLYKITHQPGVDTERLLAQTFDPTGKIRARYVGGGTNANKPGEGRPDRIVIERRETSYPDPLHPLEAKMTDWQPFETVSIRTPAEKEAAMFKINAVMNEAQGASMAIDQGTIEGLHQKRNPKPIDLGIIWK